MELYLGGNVISSIFSWKCNFFLDDKLGIFQAGHEAKQGGKKCHQAGWGRHTELKYHQNGASLPFWVKSDHSEIPPFTDLSRMVVVLEIIHSTDNASVLHLWHICNLTASSAAKLESSLPEPPRMRLRDMGDTLQILRDKTSYPEGQAKLSLRHRSYRWILSREMPVKDVTLSKMTPGIWGGQIQGGRKGGYRGSAREAQSSGEGGRLFTPDVSVTKSHTPDHPPFRKLN